MKVTIQKTMNVPDPVRAHETDAGLDLHVPEGQGVLVRPGAVYTIDLGLRAAIPDGYYGQLVVRSSAGKRGLAIPNGVGIIDSGYRGNIKLLVTALVEPVLVAAGERICQLVVLPLPAVECESGIVDNSTARGDGGFGSTGRSAIVRDYSDSDRTGQLTVGRLLRDLQDMAFRYGNDTPVAVLASDAINYEEADGLRVISVTKIGREGGWDQYRADRDGQPMAVIS